MKNEAYGALAYQLLLNIADVPEFVSQNHYNKE